MKKETLLKILYACLSIIVIVFTMSYIYYSIESKINNVYADTLEDNAILNFNQLVNLNSNQNYINITNGVVVRTNQNITTATKIATTSFSVNDNDIYYIKMPTNCAFSYQTSSFAFGRYSDIEGIRSFNSNFDITGVFAYTGFNTNVDYYFQVINLSQMFGYGNEPTTIEELKTYLPLDYYNYTLSTPINIGYSKGYTQGIVDSNSSYEYTILSNSLIKSATSVNYDNQNSEIEFLFDDGQNVISFLGIIQIPLGVSVEKGEKLIFDTDIVLMPNGTFSIGYFSNGFYVPLTSEYDMGHLTVEMVAQTKLDTLYLMCNEDATNYRASACTLVFPKITIKVNDFQKLNLLAFEQGVNSVDTQSIKEQAFEDGKNWGLNHNTNTAWGSSWDFIGSAFNGIGEIFSIELLPNVPLWTFIVIPLLFGLIAVLYKITGK